MAIMVAGLLCKYAYPFLMLFVLIVMMQEFHVMTMGHKRHLWARILTIISAIAVFATVFLWKALGTSPSYILLSVLPVLLAMAGSLFEKDKSDYATVSNAYTSFVYIALPMTMINFLVFSTGEYSGILLLCFFGIVWGADVGGYCLGCTLGKNGKKLWPEISPKKSWWGFVGGMITSVAIAVVLYFTHVFDFHIVHCIVLAVLMNVSGVFGDLVESVWKRHFGIKDSGKIMPGHGGLLDRFDSSLFALPVGIIYMMCCGLF